MPSSRLSRKIGRREYCCPTAGHWSTKTDAKLGPSWRCTTSPNRSRRRRRCWKAKTSSVSCWIQRRKPFMESIFRATALSAIGQVFAFWDMNARTNCSGRTCTTRFIIPVRTGNAIPWRSATFSRHFGKRKTLMLIPRCSGGKTARASPPNTGPIRNGETEKLLGQSLHSSTSPNASKRKSGRRGC